MITTFSDSNHFNWFRLVFLSAVTFVRICRWVRKWVMMLYFTQDVVIMTLRSVLNWITVMLMGDMKPDTKHRSLTPDIQSNEVAMWTQRSSFISISDIILFVDLIHSSFVLQISNQRLFHVCKHFFSIDDGKHDAFYNVIQLFCIFSEAACNATLWGLYIESVEIWIIIISCIVSSV